MTNLQRALVKSFMQKTNDLQAVKWNGNQLIGKRKHDKKWQVFLKDETDAEAILYRVEQEALIRSE